MLKKRQIFLLIFIFTFFCLSVPVEGSTETFTVPPLQEVVRTVTLREGDIVTGKIDVSGGSGNDINFYVTDPDGNTILRYDRASHTSFSFTATKPGTHTLHFDNSFSIISSKSVVLEYSIKTLIFGIPEDIFYLILAVILIALIIIIIVTVLKRYRPQKQ